MNALLNCEISERFDGRRGRLGVNLGQIGESRWKRRKHPISKQSIRLLSEDWAR